MGIVLLIVIGSVGLLALAIGLRGRRVGTAAHCRKCRFDLTGVYPEHLICPECGAGLEEPRATRTGRWVRRQRLLVVGVLLLALAATLGTMSARGVVTKSKIARALPTGALVALAIDRPDGWLAAEGRSVLFNRVALDGFSALTGREDLSAAQITNLAGALFRALSRPDFAEYRFHCELLNEVVENPSAPSGVRQQYADFLVDRVVRTDLPWVGDWGDVLVRHRADGLISDEAWEAMLAELITPRLWCSSGSVVEPGEVFVVRTRFLADRLRVPLGTWPGSGVFMVRPDAVAGVGEPVGGGPGAAISRYGRGLPFTSLQYDKVLVARSEPGVGEIVVEAQYAEGMTDYVHLDPREGLTHSGTLTVESRLPIEVRPVTTTAKQGDPPPTVERWLQAHLLPADRGPGNWLSSRRAAFLTRRIAVLAPGGDLVLRGSLVVVGRFGSRTTIGRFDLERTQEASLTRWNGTGNNGGKSVIRRGAGPLSEIRVPIPVECLLPEAKSRAVLVFDRVMLPDGRTFDATQPGTAPIEIDVPFDSDAGGFDW